MLDRRIYRRCCLSIIPIVAGITFLLITIRILPSYGVQAEPAGTELSPGDLAIIGASADTADFAFVLLVDIKTGTVVRFTDSGWSSSGAFRGFEGALKYTAPTDVPAGTVIAYKTDIASFTDDSDSVVGENGFDISISGDQVFVFQGASTNPNFIYAVQTNSTAWQSTATGSHDSALPAGLIDGLTAVAVGAGSYSDEEYDNAVYDMSVTSGSQTALLQAISNRNNWTGNDYPLSMPGGSFSVHIPLGNFEIAKSAPEAVAQFAEFDYTLVMTNATRSSASNVWITDTLPNGVTFIDASDGGVLTDGVVRWMLPGPIAKGESIERSLRVMANGELGSSITNNDYGVRPSDWVTITYGAPVSTMVYPIDVVLEQQGYRYASLGQTLVYTLTIRNTGNQAAINVVLRDDYPASVHNLHSTASLTPTTGTGYLEWHFGNLPVGYSTSFQIFMTPDESYSIGDTISNTAVISVDNDYEAGFNNQQTVETTFVEAVSIEDIQFVANPELDDRSPRLGDTVLVTGTITARAGEIGDDNSLMFIQDPSGGRWSGIAVYAPQGHTRTDLPEGAQVQVVGTVVELAAGDGSMTAIRVPEGAGAVQPLQPGASLQPAVLPTSELPQANPARSEAWESVLVRFESTEVTATGLVGGDWQIDDGSGPARIGNDGGLDGNLTFSPGLDDFLDSINGIGWQSAAGYKALPRSNEDIQMEYTATFVYHDEEDVILPGENLELDIYIEGEDTLTTFAMTADPAGDIFSVTILLDEFKSYTYRYSYGGIPKPDADFWVNTSDRTVFINQPGQTIVDYRNIEIDEVLLVEPASFSVTKLNGGPPVRAKLSIPYLTNQDGPARGLLAQVGYGISPAPDQWVDWHEMEHVHNESGSSYYEGSIIPEGVGTYPYLVRFNANFGDNNPNSEWVYGDLNGILQLDPADLSAAGEMVVTAPDLSVSKSVYPVNAVEPGSTLTYTITISNAQGIWIGPAHVVVTDTLPVEIEVVEDWLPDGLHYLEPTHTLVWRGTVDPGGTQVIEFPVRIKAAAWLSAGEHQFSNMATVTDGCGNTFVRYSEAIAFDIFGVFLPVTMP